jgi:hypothetical protein
MGSRYRDSNAAMVNHRWHLCTDLWVRQNLRQKADRFKETPLAYHPWAYHLTPLAYHP